MMARSMTVLLLALLVAIQVVRSAVVNAIADRSPDTAARIWPGHPAAETALAMTKIGRAAREKQAVPGTVFTLMDDAARKAPLAPEPFLVRGVQAQLAGNPQLAIRAFGAASSRDPRSLSAHYFLADTLFRAGDVPRGLEEVAILARLAPGGLASLAPYVAAYAKDSKNWPQLRQLFKAKPELEDSTLTALASDPSNLDTIMALADRQYRAPEENWLPVLVSSLVGAREYSRARQIWASTPHAASSGLVYDPHFNHPSAPPPFNWTLMSSPVGLAERSPGGGLHVIFYGHEDGLLARELLVLPAGQYRVTTSAAAEGQDSHGLNWSVRCDGSQTPLGAMPLDAATTRPWTFTVPISCPAQWLELSGVSSDVARQSEALVKSIGITADRPNG